MKPCTNCKLNKPLDDYYKEPYGCYKSQCKECLRANQRAKNVKRLHVSGPKTYKDYLKEADMYDYYKKSLRYQV